MDEANSLLVPSPGATIFDPYKIRDVRGQDTSASSHEQEAL